MKQDQKLIASKQYSEVSSVVNMLRAKNPTEEINRVTVKDIFWNCGRSRVICYEILMLMGYTVAKHPKPTAEQQKKIKELAERMGI